MAFCSVPPPPNPCGNATPNGVVISYALDYIYFDSTFNNPNAWVSIAYISINPGQMGFDSRGTPEMNWSRVRTAAAAAFRQDVQQNNPGVFVVQSAGTNGGDACLTDAANTPG